ncbi:MAG: queuosine precursor transporter [Legionella sp.]|nr:queuosine precursor transporter [Legionella sp.]
MNTIPLYKKDVRVYILLTSVVICGLAGSLITAPKIVHFGLNFPFSNIVFSILTYPIVDCICELWGKRAARQAIWIGLSSQVLITLIIQCSIMAPYPSFWGSQSEYQLILSTGINVVIASFIAFATSQLLDIVVYQKLKEISKGKKLWIRSNLSTYLGQTLDSILFVNIVFFNSHQKINLLLGSILVKIILSFLMTPIVYLIIYVAHKYLDSNTLAFKTENTLSKQLA